MPITIPEILVVQNPKYSNTSNTAIDLEVKFTQNPTVFVPITVKQETPIKTYIGKLYQNAIDLTYGAITAFTASNPTTTQLRTEAKRRFYDFCGRDKYIQIGNYINYLNTKTSLTTQEQQQIANYAVLVQFDTDLTAAFKLLYTTPDYKNDTHWPTAPTTITSFLNEF